MTGAQQYQLASAGGSAYTIKNVNSNLCVDVDASSTADGAVIQQYTCNMTGAQSFTLTDRGGGYYNIVNTNSGKCVDVAALSTADGAIIHQWTCGTGQNQQWQFR
jgi:hypothetical protein